MSKPSLKLVSSRPLSSEEVITGAFARSLRVAGTGSASYRMRHMYVAATWVGAFEPGSDQRRPSSSSSALMGMLRSIGMWADAYHKQWPDCRIADDGVLGAEWEQMLRGFTGLLNGELGDLDGGALDAAARALYAWAGFEGEL